MGRGKTLSSEEIAKIQTYLEYGLSNREIAKKINRSHSVVDNYVKNPTNYGKNRPTHGNSKLSKRQRSDIFMLAAKNKHTCSQIKSELSLPITTRRVQQILHDSDRFLWRKMLRKPALTKAHKEQRLAFAKQHMAWGEKWRNIIFSDEKKFNLDGPDGLSYYWHHLEDKREVTMSRNFGGGTLMVWAAFSYNGQSPLCTISTKMNSDKYIELLEDVLIKFGNSTLGDTWTFQQDNAAIHTSKKVKKWFRDHSIPVLSWPARSPDLNPIENLWGILARAVYRDGKQFRSVSELKKKVEEEWSQIPPEIFKNLINSMNDRIFEVISKNGGHTTY